MKIEARKSSLVCLIILGLLWYPCQGFSAERSNDGKYKPLASNLILVTLDGLRWQEVFGGVDQSLVEDERYAHEPEDLRERYWQDTREKRRALLFPFLWSVIVDQGVLIGDRQQDSYMEVSNSWWFSYPGYNEILTGQADHAIDSNDKNWNQNITFLEVLNNNKAFHNRVQVFGSWDVFPFIINTRRNGIPVNAGFTLVEPATTDRVRWLNAATTTAPRLWPTVRDDFLTAGYASEALKSDHPRVVYIALGETDDFAHDARYDRYIDAAHRADLMLSTLWSWLQSDPIYRNNTTLVITTDHGRGDTAEGWPHHASPEATAKLKIEKAPDGVPGSDQIWLGAIGPNVPPNGLIKGHWKQSQIAATLLMILGLDPSKQMPDADNAMFEMLNGQ